MSIEVIEIVPLTANYTQIPNQLINAEIGNDLFRGLCWLLSLKGGSISSRQIAKGAQVGYNGRSHRRIMRELRELKVMTSYFAKRENGLPVELLQIHLDQVLTVPARVNGSKSPNRSNELTGSPNELTGSPNALRVSAKRTNLLKQTGLMDREPTNRGSGHQAGNIKKTKGTEE